MGTSIISPLPLLSRDRKSTRLNSSHPSISYAVFCLKKKNCTITRAAAIVMTRTARIVFHCFQARTVGWSGFFFNDTATTEIYTLSLHDPLPISPGLEFCASGHEFCPPGLGCCGAEFTG